MLLKNQLAMLLIMAALPFPQAFAQAPSQGAVCRPAGPKYKKGGLSKKEDPTQIFNRDLGYKKPSAMSLWNADAMAMRNNRPSSAQLNAYVTLLGNFLKRNSDFAMEPCAFYVVESAEVNAGSMQGFGENYVMITTGLLEVLQSEAELAGVIGHELGHLAASHEAKDESHRKKMRIISGVLQMGGMVAPFGVGGVIGTVVALGAGPASRPVFAGITAKHSRDQEREADKLGIQYAFAAGYDPSALAGLLTRLAITAPKSGLFSDHPSDASRAKAIRELVDRYPAQTTCRGDSKEFVQLIQAPTQQVVNSLTLANAPAAATPPVQSQDPNAVSLPSLPQVTQQPGKDLPVVPVPDQDPQAQQDPSSNPPPNKAN